MFTDTHLSEPFRFAYDPPAICCGRGCVADLDAELAAHGFERALVVCGSTVGSTPAVIDPVRSGLGDRLAGVFARTTPEKRLSTAAAGLESFRTHDADVVVALGGGSSLDVAKQLSVLAARDDRASPEGAHDTVARELTETGTIAVPETGLVPIVAVPTTLAGADLSQGAGVTVTPADAGADPASGGFSDPGLMPAAVVLDPALFETTPESILAASAMNGLDKGIETLYARTATPVTDATATRGLSLFGEGLLAFGDGDRSAWVFEALARGSVLVQYGVSRPDGTTLSLVHALGHGLTRTTDLQQGIAHAVVAPHALEYLFSAVEGRRELLASAFGVEAATEPAGAVVDAVTEIRDALGLPGRLRDVAGPDREAFPAVAEDVLADAFMMNAPLEPTTDDIEAILEAAW